MAEEPPDDSLVELNNPIVSRGFWMLGQQLPLESAIQALLNDRQLQSAPDEELIRIIEEADRYWRDQYRDCVRKPGTIEMYPPLMIACCKQRYEALWALRKAASGEEQAALTACLGRLLTIRARCELALGESLLLNEKLQQAYETFGRAEWAARATPDEGSLRLCEILWARYGQWATANVARHQQGIESAQAGINELLMNAGPQAQVCLKKVERLFSRHQWVLGERERLRAELRKYPELAAPTSSKTSSANDSLVGVMNGLATDVQSGRMTTEEAKQRAQTEFPSLQLNPGAVLAAAGVLQSLVETDPERAVLLQEINSEFALQFQDQPYVQAFCLGSFGFTLNRMAQKRGSGFERAIEILERAYGPISSSDGSPENSLAASICNEVAVANRYLGNTAELSKWSQRALDRWEKLPQSAQTPQTVQGLGTAYGLRGEALEHQGTLDAALQDHFRALGLFRQAQSGLDVRRAYHHIFDLCLGAERLDEAAAAGNEIIEIAQQLGDLDDVQATTLPLAQAFVRVGRAYAAVPFLVRADRLVLEALETDSKNESSLALSLPAQDVGGPPATRNVG